jgi:hypothetical protein
MGLLLRIKPMAQTKNLEQFNALVESRYLSIKKYIVSSDYKKIVLEDHENYAWGKNPDLEGLFESDIQSLIKSLDVVYREKDAMFSITLNLK